MATAPTSRSRRERLRDPVRWSQAIQLVKTAAAAVIAWVLATTVLDLPQSFLAPWAALLVVHSTVYRTVSRGVRQVAAAVVGVVLAWGVGHVLGLDATAVAVVLLLGLLIGAMDWFGDEGTTLAATALVVLTTGFTDQDAMLVSRLADTGIGIAVGLAINLLVWPPLSRRTAISAMDQLDDRLGALLLEMADGVADGFSAEEAEEWLTRIGDLDEDLDHAWALVRQARESARMNPRRSARGLREPREWVALLRRVEQAFAAVRSTVRTLARGLDDGSRWQPDFRAGYAEALRAVGRAISEAEREPLQRCRTVLEELVELVQRDGAAARLWPVYGGLLVNLRNIGEAMDEVAGANPMVQPPLPFVRPPRT
jgi:uncharacterized membrane protein YgaE (UPF0421/DUF939 family)